MLLACPTVQLRESEAAIKSLTSRLHTALREGAHLRQRVEQLEADNMVSSSGKLPLTALSAEARHYVSDLYFCCLAHQF
jgi:hypothetical protein